MLVVVSIVSFLQLALLFKGAIYVGACANEEFGCK